MQLFVDNETFLETEGSNFWQLLSSSEYLQNQLSATNSTARYEIYFSRLGQISLIFL